MLRRLAVGVIGSLMVVIGLTLVPLPGPGWAIVFAGVALLGTEFSSAERLLQEVRRRLAEAVALLRRVPPAVRTLTTIAAATVALVALAVWLVLLRP